MLVELAMLVQAALPPPGLQFYARTDYRGPGLVCGASFSVDLSEYEVGVLTKINPTYGEYTFGTHDGTVLVMESQYVPPGGKVVRRAGNGELRRLRDNGRYLWVYRDNLPGSIQIYGPGVDSRKPTSALNRVKFVSPVDGQVAGQRCLPGQGSNLQTT